MLKTLVFLSMIMDGVSSQSARADSDEHKDEGHDASGHADKKDEHKGHEHQAIQEITSERVRATGLPVVKAEAGSIDVYVSLFGKIMLHPERAMHLHPRYAGIVREVFKATGDTVKAGDILARIENNVGVQTYDLTSAIGGIVLDRRIAAGQSVSEEVEAFTVADTSFVMASLVAYARDISALKTGLKLHLRIPSSSQTTTAEISYIAPLLEERTRTAEVRAYIKNEGNLWRPGQYVMGDVVTGVKTVPVRVPVAALTRRDSRTGVLFAKQGDLFRVVEVQTGLFDSEFVEIVSGLTAGQEVISMSPTLAGRSLQERSDDPKMD